MTLSGLAHPALGGHGLAASVSDDGVAAVVTLHGDADFANLAVLVDVLVRVIADHEGPIIVDLADTEFVDSGAVHALERARRFLDDRGRTLTLRSPSRVATQVLGLLDLTHLIETAQGAEPLGHSERTDAEEAPEGASDLRISSGP
jgi:anti-anti-sigma factor